jgi:hypothetical protein
MPLTFTPSVDRRTPLGITPFDRPARSVVAGVPRVGGPPSGLRLEDNQNGCWIIWPDNTGHLHLVDRNTYNGYYSDVTGASFNTALGAGKFLFETDIPTVPNIFDVLNYGAVGDGVTDDSAAILAAYTALATAGGGVLLFPGALTYRTTLRLNIQASDVTVEGMGSTLLFDPSDPVTNDRAIAVYGNMATAGRGIVGTITKGDLSFTASGSTADLHANDWLIFIETGDVALDPWFFDWVQVKSVAGAVVTLQSPFRMSFPGTHSAIAFSTAAAVEKNVVVRNLTIRGLSASFCAGMTVGAYSRQVTVTNCDFSVLNGPGFTTYLAADVTVDNNRFSGAEFASAVDLVVVNNTFGTFDTAISTSSKSLAIDFGVGFFVFANNRVVTAGNIALQVSYGCHDGVVANNTISWVADAGIGAGTGILALGGHHITYTGNALDGGAAGGTGIVLTTDVSTVPNIVSTGNFVTGNTVTGFTSNFGVISAGDFWVQPSTTSPAGQITIPNGIERVFAGPGSQASPSHTYSADPSLGFYNLAAGYQGFVSGNVAGYAESNLTRIMRAEYELSWTTTTPTGTVDLRLRRSAANTLQLDDGAAGLTAFDVVGLIHLSKSLTADEYVIATLGVAPGGAAKGYITSPANAQFNLMNAAFSAGVGFDVATDAVFKLRTRAQTGDAALTCSAVSISLGTFLITSTAAFANGAGVGGGTLLNAPAAGNPTKWIPINDNGTTRYIPAW